MSHDPYCYPGTSVLRNNLDIVDQDRLHATEARLASASLLIFRESSPCKIADEARLKATHHAIFHRLYPFAGSYRENTGTMTKGRTAGYHVTYGDSRFVLAEMARIFAQLKGEDYLRNLPADLFAAKMAYFYSEMDATHPFREGNSRTLRQFTSDLALAAGYALSWEPTGRTNETKDALYAARDRAAHLGVREPLAAIIRANLASTAARASV